MKKINYDLLMKIADNTFGNIFVTDVNGVIIFVNENTAKAFGIPREEIVGVTAESLVEKGVISKSTSLEALKKKEVVIGSVLTKEGYQLMNFSNPIFDENGEVSLVVTFGQHEYMMQKVIEEIENEKRKTEAYKEAFLRMGEVNSDYIINSQIMRKLYRQIDKVAVTESTVLLYGESGVGKDVIAGYIHKNSSRSNEPLVPINCAAIPRELMESEFFGYEKGAFTGALAKGKAGLFEIANNGTLFLDEIGELPVDIQAKFLRAIETGEITRVGGQQIINTNVRLISATNRNLPELIQEGKFREDLYFRLNVISFRIPPLRERKEEIRVLAKHFMDTYNRKYASNKYFSEEDYLLLENYHWKGNIRELKNVIERMVITTEGSHLDLKNVLEPYPPNQAVPSRRMESKSTVEEIFREEEKRKVLEILLSVNGNKTKAAELLGISKGKLYRMIR